MSAAMLLAGATAVAAAAPPIGAPLRQVPANTSRARYVAPGGNDANPGTRARPWRTIDRALRSAVPGRTIFLRAGTYAQSATATRGGSPAAPVTLRSAPRERATITGMITVTADWMRVSGLRFTGGSAGSDDVEVYVSGAAHVEVSHNEFTGSPMSAIYVGDSSNRSADVRILGNRVHDNGSDSQFHHGIYCGETAGAVIANNIVAHNAAFGIQVYPDCDDAVVANNTIVANGRAGVVVGGDGDGASQRVRVANNIIGRNGDSGVLGYFEGAVGSGRVVRNLFFANGGGAVDGDGLTASGNLSGSPRFVNESRRNYALRSGSVAIGRAVAGLAPARDIVGRARGARRDIGAIEAVPGR